MLTKYHFCVDMNQMNLTLTGVCNWEYEIPALKGKVPWIKVKLLFQKAKPLNLFCFDVWIWRKPLGAGLLSPQFQWDSAIKCGIGPKVTKSDGITIHFMLLAIIRCLDWVVVNSKEFSFFPSLKRGGKFGKFEFEIEFE